MHRIKPGEWLEFLEGQLRRDDLSDGQLYLLLQLARQADDTAAMTPFLARTMRARWTRAPYHLKLDLLHSSEMCSFAHKTDKDDLIQAIESLPTGQHLFLSSAIVEALSCLGALEHYTKDHFPVIREDVKECLARPKDPGSHAAAYRIYISQFDHPHSSAYCEVVSELSDQDRKSLLLMAVQGAERYGNLTTLIGELASYGDPATCECLVRFTELPPRDGTFPQDDIGAFVVAHVALGKLGCQLPDRPSVH